ncbi:hypothetical protein BH23GEM6_BH23GEM6_03330 [soil metagenome]
MNNLLYLAILLVIIWVVARVVGFVAGALLHLLWVIAIILVIVWLVRRIL